MNILYFTTSLKDEDYTALLNEGYALTNPSNQNFHSKLIQALSLNDKVQVLSYYGIPYDEKTLVSSDNYHYVFHSTNPFLKWMDGKDDLVKEGRKFADEKDNIILFDSLNVTLGKAALKLAKELHCPALAILTDNPENLAKTPYLFRKCVKDNVLMSDGALALSTGLLKSFGLMDKPHSVFEGLVEEFPEGRAIFPAQSYVYFGGALLARYGINDLLEAYLKTEPSYDLVIAGHTADQEDIARIEKANPRVKFIGQVSKQENYILEKNASLLVNPRPYEEKLDQESIPSKMLEYLASGTPIVSFKHTTLQALFPDDVNWLEGSGEKALEAFFSAHLDAKKEWINLKANHSHEKLYSHYSLMAIGKLLHDFLANFNSLSK